MSDMIWESKTIDMAIDLAIKELECKREDIDIEIIQEPVKGIFGIQKMAKIKVARKGNHENEQSFNSDQKEVKSETWVTANNNSNKEIRLFLENTLKFMGVNKFEMTYKEENGQGIFNITCDYEGLLIGKHGKTLEALQYLLNQVVNKNDNIDKNQRYLIDVGNYLKRHKEQLEKIALSAAKKAKETNEEQQLSAMNAYDRKTIHLLLKDDTEISTYSLGEGIFRHVIVSPKKNKS